MFKILQRNLQRGRRPLVWGSGLLDGRRPMVSSHLRYLSVRGPLTAKSLRLKQPRFGDPGIIARELVPESRKTHRLGIVPHYVEAGIEALARISAAYPHSQVISVEQDWRSVIRQISACELIISISLHGLIVADGFGIPNVRVEFSPRSGLDSFKFRAYAASVGRPEKRMPCDDPF